MDLNLSNQTNLRNQILPAIVALKNAMIARKPMWDKLPFRKRKAWVMSDKDPIMSLAWDIYKALDEYFDIPDSGES